MSLLPKNPLCALFTQQPFTSGTVLGLGLSARCHRTRGSQRASQVLRPQTEAEVGVQEKERPLLTLSTLKCKIL